MTAPERRIRCNVFLTKTEAEGLKKLLSCSVIMSEEKQPVEFDKQAPLIRAIEELTSRIIRIERHLNLT